MAERGVDLTDPRMLRCTSEHLSTRSAGTAPADTMDPPAVIADLRARVRALHVEITSFAPARTG
jgi:hypothetical protein